MKFPKIILQEGSELTFKKILILITFTVVICFAIFHLDRFFELLGQIYHFISPFLLGLIFAFVINIPMSFFERTFFLDETAAIPSIKPHHHYISLILSLLFIVGVIIIIVLLIVPELVRSIASLTQLADSVPSYWNEWVETINQFFQDTGLSEYKESIKLDWNELVNNMVGLIHSSRQHIFQVLMRITSGFLNILIALVLAIYLLIEKEKLIQNLKQLLFAFFTKKQASSWMKIGVMANKIFSGYVSGQVTEAFILGTLCYIGMTILRTPYPLLVSVIVGVTGIIPVFGSFIGGSIGAFIILVVNPSACLWFVIFLIILQNIESNFIYPRIMGNSVGLPGLWVIASLIIFGNLLGLLGMLIGIPTFSLLYALFAQETSQRLNKKNISNQQLRNISKVDYDISEAPIIEQRVQNKGNIDEF